jgi:hypothetical protein
MEGGADDVEALLDCGRYDCTAVMANMCKRFPTVVRGDSFLAEFVDRIVRLELSVICRSCRDSLTGSDIGCTVPSDVRVPIPRPVRTRLKGHLHEGEREREQGEFLLLQAREREAMVVGVSGG